MTRRSRRQRATRRILIGPLVVAIACGAASYAFAANLTVLDTAAGDGNAAISKDAWTITQLSFRLDTTNPLKIVRASFTMSGSSPSPNDVRAQIGGSSWTSCSKSGSNYTCTWSGSLPDYPFNNTTPIRVIAVP
jgi:hypothetical protein